MAKEINSELSSNIKLKTKCIVQTAIFSMSESIENYLSGRSRSNSISSHSSVESYSLHGQSSVTHESIIREIEIPSQPRVTTIRGDVITLEEIATHLAELRLQVLALSTVIEQHQERILVAQQTSQGNSQASQVRTSIEALPNHPRSTPVQCPSRLER